MNITVNHLLFGRKSSLTQITRRPVSAVRRDGAHVRPPASLAGGDVGRRSLPSFIGKRFRKRYRS